MNDISCVLIFFLLLSRCIINSLYNFYRYMYVHLIQIFTKFVLQHVCETFPLDFNRSSPWHCSIVSSILHSFWVCYMKQIFLTTQNNLNIFFFYIKKTNISDFVHVVASFVCLRHLSACCLKYFSEEGTYKKRGQEIECSMVCW